MENNEQINTSENVHYAGFNIRLLAQIIDSVLLFLIFIPLGYLFPKMNQNVPPEVLEAMHRNSQGAISPAEFNSIITPYFMNELLPQILVVFIIQFVIVGIIFVIFWKKKGSTPGKALLKLKVVDAKTFGDLSIGQSILRFIGYFVCMATFMLGFTMVIFNKRRRGLHDIMADTVVIYDMEFDPDFEQRKFKYQTYFFVTILLFMAIYLAAR